ncbi:hypothetical protein [Streptomyces lydicus]|uniref:hypothetical protein n=1 Tax=Streptomyces lydicus TaxID=47763 RepID=UPI0010128223|nr:hypothetical protein [Streptomyces lydicus]MCZ1011896.1 hypothetical protein [Streptomyces lydicus]
MPGRALELERRRQYPGRPRRAAAAAGKFLSPAAPSYESDTDDLSFSPTGGHPVIAVPLHRIVALTGDRQRRTPGSTRPRAGRQPQG